MILQKRWECVYRERDKGVNDPKSRPREREERGREREREREREKEREREIVRDIESER